MTPLSEAGTSADELRRMAFADILSFQPDTRSGKDVFEQIAIHARSTIIETQKQIAALIQPAPVAVNETAVGDIEADLPLTGESRQPTPAETEGEPVAWQKRWIGGTVLGEWELCTNAASVESFRAANSSRYEYRALYASPTPPPIGDGEGDLRTLVPGFRLDWSGLRNRFEEDLARLEKMDTYEMRAAHLDEMARQFEDAIVSALEASNVS